MVDGSYLRKDGMNNNNVFRHFIKQRFATFMVLRHIPEVSGNDEMRKRASHKSRSVERCEKFTWVSEHTRSSTNYVDVHFRRKSATPKVRLWKVHQQIAQNIAESLEVQKPSADSPKKDSLKDQHTGLFESDRNRRVILFDREQRESKGKMWDVILIFLWRTQRNSFQRI